MLVKFCDEIFTGLLNNNPTTFHNCSVFSWPIQNVKIPNANKNTFSMNRLFDSDFLFDRILEYLYGCVSNNHYPENAYLGVTPKELFNTWIVRDFLIQVK